MTPNEAMNLIRLADTGEMREILEKFHKEYPLSYIQLINLIAKFNFKRKPNEQRN